MEILGSFLQILLIIIALSIVLINDNIKAIILLSGFSLITAGLYFLNKAPDVALAEVAIGSAIMPLLYILAISKQREFIILSYVNKDFLSNEIINLLNEFADYYKLKLNFFNKSEYKENYEILKNDNLDLIIKLDKENGNYNLICRRSSILINKLQQMATNLSNVSIIKIQSGENYD